MKRLVPMVTLAIAAGVFGGARASCLSATVAVNFPFPGPARNSAGLSFDEAGTTVTLVMVENQDNTACSDGAVEQSAPDRRLLITKGGATICDLDGDDGGPPAEGEPDTRIDPSFDPFFFGAGIHRTDTRNAMGAPVGSCGASVSMASIPNPPIDPVSVSADPDDPAVAVTGRKDVVTEVAGRYWYTDSGGSHLLTIPQDTQGWVERSLRVTAVP